jgi:hypothetical protein
MLNFGLFSTLVLQEVDEHTREGLAAEVSHVISDLTGLFLSRFTVVLILTFFLG